MPVGDISLETVLNAQQALNQVKAKHDQYAKELVSAEKRAARLILELEQATKTYSEIKDAYEKGVKAPAKNTKVA